MHRVVEAVVRMSMDPQLRAIGAEQVFGIRNEAGVQQRVGEPRMNALPRRRVMGDHHCRSGMRVQAGGRANRRDARTAPPNPPE